MGCGMSTEEKEGKARNEEIENQLKRDKMLQRNEIKMLLLGQFSSRIRLPGMNKLTSVCRCWRVWKVDDPETDEAHPRRWLFS